MSTIDPGIEEGISKGADEVQPDKPDYDHEKEEEEYLMQPSRWWFASTACPLLAGTFGPMASGFNIVSLSYHWREYIAPGGTESTGMQVGDTLEDPPWEIALNALSLLAAIVGNGTLLLNMAQRMKFSIAQPITIVGFLLGGILLIADVAALAGPADDNISIADLLVVAGPRDANVLPSEGVTRSRHALTGSFYFATFAGAIYIVIGLLMCLTVYGANQGHYPKQFKLTPPQRTLMLQTMSFIAYLLLGALVYSHIEGWAYVNAIYWADVTLLTVGLGDFSPSTKLGRGLLFPFAIGGILMVGLVVGSIRSLILERGKQKMEARIVEKRRSNAIHNVDERKQTIRISYLASADFSTDPGLSPAQKRKEEFNVMRKVQDAAERERRWMALATSTTFAFILWLAGAAIFQKAEYKQHWTYMEALYFSYTSLLTIGYGDYAPYSNAGKAFFVLWSLLAVPSLTILISNMGDTIVAWFSDVTIAIGSITVLPDDTGFRGSMWQFIERLMSWSRDSFSDVTLRGLVDAGPMKHEKRMDRSKYEEQLLDRLAERLSNHTANDHESGERSQRESLEQDIQFYQYVLARECRTLQKDLSSSPPKKYRWDEWEYFLKLMGNEDDPQDLPGGRPPDLMVPEPLRASPRLEPSDRPAGRVESNSSDHLNAEKSSSSSEDPPSQYYDAMDGNVDRQTSRMHKMNKDRKPRHPEKDRSYLRDWSWLSNESPLMSTKSEAEWVLERLSAALERELDRQRKGYKRQPPIRVKDARHRSTAKREGEKEQEESEK